MPRSVQKGCWRANGFPAAGTGLKLNVKVIIDFYIIWPLVQSWQVKFNAAQRLDLSSEFHFNISQLIRIGNLQEGRLLFDLGFSVDSQTGSFMAKALEGMRIRRGCSKLL